MLHLKTFGGLSVSVDDAAGVGAAQQRKTLALLALLAAAGKSGLARDKLVAYLWPDADAEHARGLLKQACYALRRDLHQPDLVLGTTQLVLNPAIIASDVQAFEDALGRRDDAAAVALYVGPFLDGFYLSGAEEFERWLEAERGRLRQRAAAALERLATGATAAGEHIDAAAWWRRLAALDPLNSRVALGLMNALAAAGDRAGALQVARVHESLLRDQLGVALDAAVVALTERLRAEPESSQPPRRIVVPEPAEPEDGAPDRSEAEVGAIQPDVARAGVARRPFVARKRLPLVVVVVAAGLLVGGSLMFGVPFRAHGEAAAPRPKRIVVLPLTNLGLAEDEYFADGVTEEMTARLASSSDLRVIGSTSAHVYKGTKKAIAEIGRELGVDYVLEGSVRWEKPKHGGARVRVTPQLVSTADGTHLWAEVYDEPLDGIFRVQSDIAQKVVQALNVTLLDPQQGAVQAVPTRNLEAYDFYLRGRDYNRRGSDENTLRAGARMYEKAVELDPAFALAYARLSALYSRMYWSYFDHSKQRLGQAKASVDRALQLEPGLPAAHQSLAVYYGLGGLDYDRALREFALAEVTRPGDQNIFVARATVRVRQGKIREALADYEKARQLEPASSTVASNYGQPYDLLREYPRAESLYTRAITLAPDRKEPYLLKIWLYLRWDGRTQRARAVLDQAQAAGVADERSVVYARVLMDIFDRSYDKALALLASDAPEIVVADQFRVVPRAQLYAFIYSLTDHPALARAYSDSARSILYKKVQADPDDPRLRTALGIAYAGLGRKQEAIQEGLKAVELMPISREAFKGYHHAWEQARIYTMVGEYDVAIDRLAYLLSIPGQLTPAWLRMDPVWDPLRSHPRFQKLVGGGQ